MAESRKMFAAPVKAPARPKTAPAPPMRAASLAPGPAASGEAAGNQQTLRALGIHPALAVSAPTDPDELEADRAADAFVARAPLPVGFGARGVLADIRRKCASCEEERISRKADGSSARSAAIHALPTSRGEPLTPRLRAPYERFFHADLSAVRIHTGGGADAAARSFSATAFARGNDVYFRDGSFDPSSRNGARLLAHETAHVVQQARRGGEAIHRQAEAPGVLGGLLSAGADVALRVVERLAPGVVTFFRGVRGTIAAHVSAAFDSLLGSVAARMQGRGLAGALESILTELAGDALKGAGDLVTGHCAALGAQAQLLLKIGAKLGSDALARLREKAAAIGAGFSELWQLYGAPAAETVRKALGDVWKDITEQVSEWWQELAPVRERAGKAWDYVVQHVTEGYTTLQGYLDKLFAEAVKDWEEARKRILPFMGVIKVVAAIMLLLSPAGPIVALGLAAYGLYEAGSFLWNHWGGRLTQDMREYLSKQVLPAVTKQLDALHQKVDDAKAWLGSLADELAAQGAALLQEIAAIPAVQAVAGVVDGIAADLQDFGKRARAAVDEFAKSATEFCDAAAFYLQPIGEFLRQSTLVLTLGPFALLDDGVWQSVNEFAAIAQRTPCLREMAEFIRLPVILEAAGRFRAGMKAAWTLVKNPEPIWAALHDALTPMATKVPALATTALAGILYPTDEEHRRGVEKYLRPVVDTFIANWWEELKKLGWTLIWPFDEMGEQLPKLVEHGSKAIGALFDLEIGLALDELLAMQQSANAVLGALWGWFAVASVLIGGALGALGVEFTAGASIAAGAGAGWALAEEVGMALLVTAAATEGLIIARSMFDIRFTNSLMKPEERANENEKDYKSIANSVFTLAVMGGLLVLGAIAQKIASAVWDLVADFVPGKNAITEFLNKPRGGQGTEPGTTGQTGLTGDTGAGDTSTTTPKKETGAVEDTTAKEETTTKEEAPAAKEEPATKEEKPTPDTPEEKAAPVEDKAPPAEEKPATTEEEPAAKEEAPPEDKQPPKKSAAEAKRDEMRRQIDDLEQERTAAQQKEQQLDLERFKLTAREAKLNSDLQIKEGQPGRLERGTEARANALDELNSLKKQIAELDGQIDAEKTTQTKASAKQEGLRNQLAGRTEGDVAIQKKYEGELPPEAKARPATVGDSPTQNADVARWVEQLEKMNAKDIRVDQIQVDADSNVVGENRPDLQFTLDGERYYVEWDRPSSARGPEHEIRIRANDPTATSGRTMEVKPGYALPNFRGAKITLITME